MNPQRSLRKGGVYYANALEAEVVLLRLPKRLVVGADKDE